MEFSRKVVCVVLSFGAMSALFSSSITSVRADELQEYWGLDPMYGIQEFFNEEQECVEPLQIADAEQQLVRVTSDTTSDVYDLRVSVNSDFSLKSLKKYTNNSGMEEFTIDQLRSGVVLMNKRNTDVIKITVQNFDLNSGGILTLRYLSNFITKSFGEVSVEFVRVSNHWMVRLNDRSGRREFRSMFLKARKFLGQVVGIKDVEMN